MYARKVKSLDYKLLYVDSKILQNHNLPQFAKLNLARNIAFILQHGALKHEVELLVEVLKKVVFEGDINYRIKISTLLAEHSYLPQEVIYRLIHDHQEVAKPILEGALKLRDQDLLQIIRSKTGLGKKYIIASRKSLSATVIQELLKLNDLDIIKILLKNNNITINSTTYAYIIKEYSSYDECMDLLLARKELTPGMKSEFQDMIFNFQGNFERKRNQKRHRFDPVKFLNVRFNTGAEEEDSIRREVDFLHKQDKLNSMLLISALCKGNSFFFIYGVARLTKLPFANVKAILQGYDNYDDFSGVCKRAGISSDLIEVLRHLVRIIMEEEQRLTPDNFAEIVSGRMKSLQENMHIQKVEFILRLIQAKVHR